MKLQNQVDNGLAELLKEFSESLNNFSVQYNEEDMLYTVEEVSRILKTNINYVYDLLNNGLLPYLVLGRRKIRKQALDDFLKKYEGYDLSNPEDIKKIREDGVA